jgi:tetratricopeptide (TPR) repeat protein
MPLSSDEQIHLTAAQGFLALGMLLEGNNTLDDIDPFCRHLSQVLAVRVKVSQALERWELMQAVAKRMVEYDPDDSGWWVLWAQVTSKAESIEAGKLILVNALERHPLDAGVHFNLACYECRLENMDDAKYHLKRCFELDPSWRAMALGDERLEALWEALS